MKFGNLLKFIAHLISFSDGATFEIHQPYREPSSISAAVKSLVDSKTSASVNICCIWQAGWWTFLVRSCKDTTDTGDCSRTFSSLLILLWTHILISVVFTWWPFTVPPKLFFSLYSLNALSEVAHIYIISKNEVLLNLSCTSSSVLVCHQSFLIFILRHLLKNLTTFLIFEMLYIFENCLLFSL